MRLVPAMVLTLLLIPVPALADGPAHEAGRYYSQEFLAGRLGNIWTRMTPDMRDAFGTIEGLVAFRDSVARDFGSETGFVAEEVVADDTRAEVYSRTSRWSAVDVPVLMQWVLTPDQRISGFQVRLAPVLAPSRFLDHTTRTPLRLPFDGEWYVVWGGRTLEQNYHAADVAQRFAFDALVVRGGSTHSGDASDLASYHCWDQVVRAPAAGKAVSVVRDLPDNPIGDTDAENPAGNHIVIDFGNGEFAFLAHMREGSIVVEEGDEVQAGQELGRCGNSGNSSEPHIHFHLQTTPDLRAGEGLPAFFLNYSADGRSVAKGEPAAGETIAPR